MACFHPLPAFKTEQGEVSLRKWNGDDGSTPMKLACGGCLGCRKAKAKEWALRCFLELEKHGRASFTTLTYDDEHQPITLNKRHVQLFLKRLRKAANGKRRPKTARPIRWDTRGPIRFFACGEYGETTLRPHYHAILYGTEDQQLVDDSWGKGFTRTEPLTPARIAYAAGYSAKKIGWKLDNEERIDYETGEIYQWQAPFIQMSRRPGIGAHAKQWVSSWREYAVYNGQRQPVPRFLHEAWKAQATEEEIETLANEKAQIAQRRQTPDPAATRAAREKIAIAQQQIAASRRKL